MKVKVYPYRFPDGSWSSYLATEEYLLALGMDCNMTCFYHEVESRQLDKQGRILRKTVVSFNLLKLKLNRLGLK